MKTASAYANANIALVKYWGKFDEELNIPAVSSLSMTLDDFGTYVTIDRSLKSDHVLFVNGKPSSESRLLRLKDFIEKTQRFYPFDGYFCISAKSNIPISAGLASSASFFAALSLALNHLLELKLSLKELSILARMGSGSAARSIFSNFVGLHGGSIKTNEAFAFPLKFEKKLDISLIIAIISKKEKPMSSQEAMIHTKKTSPFFSSFLKDQQQDFLGAINALKFGSFQKLGQIMEHSTLKMFATIFTARPAINFWHKETIELINFIYDLRKRFGPLAFFTMDAGPNVKILCEKKHAPFVKIAIEKLNLAQEILLTKRGLGARIVKERA